MPEHTIRGLTLHRPWCWAILNAGKDVENRPWRCQFLRPGDFIAIHSGVTYDEGGYDYLCSFGYGIAAPLADDPDWQSGFIHGVVQYQGTVTASDSRWFFGPYGWKLGNPVVIDPVACRGAQGLFSIPINVLKQVRTSYARALRKVVR